jgi:hypothetical protein
MSVVETSSPHLRVSAVNASAKTQKQQPSTRIQAPEALVDDHFFWTYTEEPHRSRRQAIIKAHPEVRDPALWALVSSTGVADTSMRRMCGVPAYTWPLFLSDQQPQQMQLQC